MNNNIVDIKYQLHVKKFIDANFFTDIYEDKLAKIDKIPVKNTYVPVETRNKHDVLINDFDRFIKDTSNIFTKNIYHETNLGNIAPGSEFTVKTRDVGARFGGAFDILSAIKLYQTMLGIYDRPVFSFKNINDSMFISEGVDEHKVDISFSFDISRNKEYFYVAIVNGEQKVTKDRLLIVNSKSYDEYIYDWYMQESNTTVSINSPYAWAVKNNLIVSPGIIDPPQILIQTKVHRIEITDLYVGIIKAGSYPYTKEITLDINDKDFFIIGAKTKLFDSVIKYNNKLLKIGERNTTISGINKIELIFESNTSYIESLQILM